MSESKELRAEALRTTAGVMAARNRGEAGDAAILLEGFMEFAKERGCRADKAWFNLFSAAVYQATQLAEELAGERNIDFDEIAREMGFAALEWGNREH